MLSLNKGVAGPSVNRHAAVVLIQTSYPISPQMCGTFFPQLPGSWILDVLRREALPGRARSALRFVFPTTPTRLAPIGRKRPFEIRAGRWVLRTPRRRIQPTWQI